MSCKKVCTSTVTVVGLGVALASCSNNVTSSTDEQMHVQKDIMNMYKSSGKTKVDKSAWKHKEGDYAQIIATYEKEIAASYNREEQHLYLKGWNYTDADLPLINDALRQFASENVIKSMDLYGNKFVYIPNDFALTLKHLVKVTVPKSIKSYPDRWDKIKLVRF